MSVYYDHHPRNEWAEHTRDEEQISAVLDDAVIFLKWKTAEGEWRELRLQGPTAWIIPAGTSHALVLPDPAEMVTLFMERSYADEMATRAPSIVIVATLAQLSGRDALIGRLTKTFRRLCREPAEQNALYIESIGTLFGSHLLRGILSAHTPQNHRPCLPTEVLQRITCYIEEHLGEHIDLALLGRVAGLSPSHFGRLFKASMDMTPHEYVMSRRVAKAENLLEQTDKKEVEIAFLCGFSDDTLMARWFRRILECRPSEVRLRRLRCF